MLPALGAVSLAWAISCLVFTSSNAAVGDTPECCKCDTLMPFFSADSLDPQEMPSPFKIEVNRRTYDLDGEVIVTLNGTEGYRFTSFFLGAYKAGWKPSDKVVGTLTELKKPNQTPRAQEDCRNTVTTPDKKVETYNALVSIDKAPKEDLQFSWQANKVSHGKIEFRASFVVNNIVYWVAEKSKPVYFYKDRPEEESDGSIQYIPEIDTSTCGNGKGCFREPAGCVEAQCLYILTWSSKSDFITFELGGLGDNSQDRYVAVGISDDTYMGEDTVFTCAHDSSAKPAGRTSVFFSFNQDNPKKNIPLNETYRRRGSTQYLQTRYSFLDSEEGSYYNARLRCRFTVLRDLDQISGSVSKLPHVIRGGPKHLLFARGFAVKGRPERHGLGVNELPLASEGRVDFNSDNDYSGRASYPLAKAHGCLMILAWVFFASIGLLMTKYYKPMWPNKRMFEQRYWFVAHFNFMATTFIIVIIGIILIFVEAGGEYSEAPDLPQKAHPILGIIILVCIIINPILALLRPSEDSKCRPVFNWFHWAFGTIANVLAIPTIFIGMDFGKVQVPWWATWILVIWVIFHIIVELTLEIHQCCTHKKNKERRKKWEALKREYPKQHHPEPEPAGRRFKRFMLFLHVAFTALITLIMIIVIAVS